MSIECQTVTRQLLHGDQGSSGGGEGVVASSALIFVDLAGSEATGKAGAEGKQL
jgi:hypothetical protein